MKIRSPIYRDAIAPIEAEILFLAFFGQEKIEAESGK